MKREEAIKRYGEAVYEKRLEQGRQWYDAHPEKALVSNREANRKGGKRYEKKLIYNQTGVQGARNSIRHAHGNQYRQYKKIIAPGSQIHHEWAPGSSEYTGLALVEADQHMHGIVGVIKILEGEVNLFTEREIAVGGRI